MKLLFIISEDWYFVSHRLEMAKYLIQRGWQVGIACRVREHRETIESAGITLLEVPFHRESAGLFDFTKDVKNLRNAIKAFNPDLVQCVAIRSILSGWLATWFLPKMVVFYAVTGLGSLFSAKISKRLLIVRWAIGASLKILFRRARSYVIVQNRDDYATFLRRKWSKELNTLVVRGAGVDVDAFTPVPEPEYPVPVLVFVGRLLHDKGIRETLEAVKSLNESGCPCHLKIAGEIDPCNPNAMTETEQEKWRKFAYIEFLGKRSDVIELMSAANLVVMPSYREGLPKVLLEAGLAQRAVVTCDTRGCREVVEHGKNGLMVPIKDANVLAQAIRILLEEPAKRKQMALANRQKVAYEFSSSVIFPQMDEIFREKAIAHGIYERN